MRIKKQYITYNKNQEPIVLKKTTLDLLLQQDHPSDLIGLYTFYYYTAKWQETNQPKCTNPYIMKGLKWTKTKLLNRKKILISLGLIEKVTTHDQVSKKIIGHYIKVHFVVLRKSQGAKKLPSGFSVPKYSDTNNKKKEIIIKKITQDFNQFWETWPKNRRMVKSTAFTSFQKKYEQKKLPKINILIQILELHKKQDQWLNEKYIPHPTTWLNQERWNDEIEGLEKVLCNISIKKINKYQSEDHHLGRNLK